MATPRTPDLDDGPSLNRGSDPGGMVPLAEFEAQQEAEAGDEEAAEPDEDELITRVSDERLRELKQRARAMIEERLKAKRKQRRLMRKGEAEW